MDRELKIRWLEALRSGRYMQGGGFLRRNGAHCCLGVLCDLIDPTGWDGSSWDGSSWRGKTGNLPMPERVSIFGAAYVDDKLIGMNDGGNSFAEIADWIEANL